MLLLPLVALADCSPDTEAEFAPRTVVASSDKDLSNFVIKYRIAYNIITP